MHNPIQDAIDFATDRDMPHFGAPFTLDILLTDGTLLAGIGVARSESKGSNALTLATSGERAPARLIGDGEDADIFVNAAHVMKVTVKW